MKSMLSMILLVGLLPFFSGCWYVDKHASARFDASTVVFDQNVHPLVILGNGIGGLTAALYCTQANIAPLVIEGPTPGGTLCQSHSVRNWPGVIDAPGTEIVGNVQKQVVQHGAVMDQASAVSVDFSQWPRIIDIKSPNGGTKTLKALSVIIAMGTEPNQLGIPGESGPSGYWGRGIANCAICEGSLYKNKVVAVVGGGDAAVTQAEYLANIAQKVIIFVRKDTFRANDKQRYTKVIAQPNVDVRFNTEVKEILGDGIRVTSIKIFNNKTNETSELPIDCLFRSIGSRPNTDLFKGQLELDERGYIKRHNYQESSASGIFVAGSICNYEFAQAITAASDGCKAALQAVKFLKDIGFDNSVNKKPLLDNNTAVDKAGQETTLAEIKTQQDFESKVIQSQKPIVLEVFSAMCVTCQQMMPYVYELAEKFQGASFVKIDIANSSINIDEVLRMLSGTQIQSIPTFLFIENGKEVGRFVTDIDTGTLENKLKSILKLT